MIVGLVFVSVVNFVLSLHTWVDAPESTIHFVLFVCVKCLFVVKYVKFVRGKFDCHMFFLLHSLVL